MIPFGEWLPDRPPRDNPGAIEAKNVTPIAGGYGPCRALNSFTNALDTRCRGAVSGIAGNLSVFTFAGDAGKLYRLSNATWSDVSQMGGYSTGADEVWNFVEFGRADRLVIATNFTDVPQKWVLGTSSAFADLSATAPKARYMGVVGDFLVVGNVDDSTDGNVPSRVAWGPINNPEGVWTPSQTTQADFQDLKAGGEITGVVGGEYGSILCRTAVYRMTYVGVPLIFRFDEVSRNTGCVAPGSVASHGAITIFLSEDGFVLFDGQQLAPIGANKVDSWFDEYVSGGGYGRISATMDPARKLYLCAFPADGQDSPSRILIYNWELNRWAWCEQDCEVLARLLSPGYTLEQLANISASIDALPASLDSRQWQGGAVTFGGFDLSHQFGPFGGATKEAVIDTAETQIFDPARAFVRGVRPIVDATATVALGTRDSPTATVAWTGDMTVNARTHLASFRSDARYHRARVRTSGDFSFAQGVDIEATRSGSA